MNLNRKDAPEGYSAQIANPEKLCRGCAFQGQKECPHKNGNIMCAAQYRDDGFDVIFQEVR